MTKQLAIKMITLTCIIGVLGLAINTVFGSTTVTYIRLIQVNGVYMYKYDFFNYMENIRNTFTNVAELELKMPERVWINEININNWWDVIVNNLGFLVNVVIILLNIIIYPLRIGFYAIEMILSFLGVPTIAGTYDNNPLKWLVTLCKTMIDLQVPYI